MGQRIEVETTTILGDSAIFTADRGFTGMDGIGFDDAEAAAAAGGFPGDLAIRIFDVDDSTSRVYVSANEVIVTRSGGWSDAAVSAVADVIEEFFLYY